MSISIFKKLVRQHKYSTALLVKVGYAEYMWNQKEFDLAWERMKKLIK